MSGSDMDPFAAKVVEVENEWQKAIGSSGVSSTFSKRLRVLLNDVADGAEYNRREQLLKKLEGWILEERKHTPKQKRRLNRRRSCAAENGANGEDGWRELETTNSNFRDVETHCDDFELIPTPLQKVQNLSLKAFGSSAMGLSLKGGDLDISLEGSVGSERLGHWRMCGRHGSRFEKDLLKEVHRVLRKKHFGKNELVLGTRIPVSKFAERTTGIECDLSVGNTLGVFKSRLLGKVIKLDPRVKELIVSVKKWARANCINHSPSGTFNSYCLTLAVICFCQSRSPSILPPFKELFPGLRAELNSRKPVLSFLQEYEGSLKKWEKVNKGFLSSNKESLFDLFINFLMVFRQFALDSVKGGSRGAYEILTGSAWEGGFQPVAWNKRGFLFVDDPFEPFANNTARTLNGRGWDLFAEILKRSNKAIQNFANEGGDLSNKFWLLWRDLFNASHKHDPAPTKSAPRKKKREGRNPPANEVLDKSRSVVLVNRLANGQISSQEPQALVAGPSSTPNGNRTGNGPAVSATTESPQRAARARPSRNRSKMNAAKIAANDAAKDLPLSNKVGGKNKSVTTKADKAGNTPLHCAALSGSTKNLNDLICEGNVNVKNKKGETPLMLAAAGGHLSCVQLLLHGGAKKTLCDKWGTDARMMVGLYLTNLYEKDYENLARIEIDSKSDKRLQGAQKFALKWMNIKPNEELMTHARKKRSMQIFSKTEWKLEHAVRRAENRAKLEELLAH